MERTWDFPGGASDREPARQYRRHRRCRLDLSVGKMPWRRKWQLTHFLDWKIPWTEDLGRLQSMGLQRVGCNSASTQASMHQEDLMPEFPLQQLLQ